MSLTLSAAVPLAPMAEASHDIPVVHPVSGGGVFDLLWLVVALPALGAAVILVLGNRRTSAWAHLLGCATVAGSFVLSLIAFVACSGATRATGRSASTSTPGSRPARSRPRWASSTTRCRRCSCC